MKQAIKRIWKVLAVAGTVMALLQSVAFVMFMYEEAVQTGGFGFMVASQAKDYQAICEMHQAQDRLIREASTFTDSWGRLAFWTYPAYHSFFEASNRTNTAYLKMAETKIRETLAKNATQAANITQVKPPEVYIPQKGDILVKAWIMDKEYPSIVQRLKLEKMPLLDGPYYRLTGHVEVRGESKSGASWKLRFPALGVELYLSKGFMVIAA